MWWCVEISRIHCACWLTVIFRNNTIEKLDNIFLTRKSVASQFQAKSLDNSTGTSSILLQVLVDHDREEQERSLPNCATSHYTAVFNKVSSKLLVDEPIKVQNTDPNRDVRVVLNGKHSDYFHISPSKVRGSAVLTLQVLNSQALTLLDNRELQFQIQLHTSDAADPTSSNCSLTIKLFNPTDYLFSTQPPNFSDEFVVVASSTVSSKVPAPQFYRVELEENSPAQVILQLNIPDNVRIEINGEGSEYFAINNRGQLICLEALDAEHARQIDLDVILMQEDGHAEQGQTMHVIIDVLDVNDNAPQFEQSHYRFTLPENNQGFFQVKAFDEDEEENAQLSYSIVNEQNLKVSITINKGTGELTVGKIDADLLKATDGTIEFTVKASDYGVPQLSNTTNVVITVQSQRLNNSGPKFLQPKYDVVVECLPPTVNYTLLTVKAVSSQAVSNSIEYIVSEPAAPYFSIITSENGAGELRLLKSLPETANSEDGFKFEVVARDVNDSNESRVPVTVYLKACPVELKYQAQAAKTAVLQKLANVDKKKTEESYSKFDTQPQTLNTKFVPWHYNIDLKENTPVGTQILKLEVPELAQTAFGFELMEENSRLLRLDNNGSILVASKIDYELEQSKEIKANVFAISDRQRLHFATVRVLIQDENDNKPQFRIPDKHKILLSEWTGVGTVLKLPIPLAEDADGSDAYSTIQYSLVEDTPDHYFEINSSTSELRLVRKLFKPLEVEICGDSFKQVRIVLGNDQGVFGLVPLTAKYLVHSN
uniref:Cadherin domain-containing protein n=1 Tax=Ditylenchus dipsaci TaxID=166011 RepID=A0A915DK20_9BILA